MIDGKLTAIATLPEAYQQKLLLAASLIIRQSPLSVDTLYQFWPQYHPSVNKMTSPVAVITLNSLTLCYQSAMGYVPVTSRLDQYLLLFTLIQDLSNHYGQDLLTLPALKINHTYCQLVGQTGVAAKKVCCN